MKTTLPIEIDIQEVYDTLTYKQQQEFINDHIADLSDYELLDEIIARDLLKEIDKDILLEAIEKQG
jgi:hypothetical protein